MRSWAGARVVAGRGSSIRTGPRGTRGRACGTGRRASATSLGTRRLQGKPRRPERSAGQVGASVHILLWRKRLYASFAAGFRVRPPRCRGRARGMVSSRAPSPPTASRTDPGPMPDTVRHFVSIPDFTRDELLDTLDLAERMKRGEYTGRAAGGQDAGDDLHEVLDPHRGSASRWARSSSAATRSSSRRATSSSAAASRSPTPRACSRATWTAS